MATTKGGGPLPRTERTDGGLRFEARTTGGVDLRRDDAGQLHLEVTAGGHRASVALSETEAMRLALRWLKVVGRNITLGPATRVVYEQGRAVTYHAEPVLPD